MGKSAPKGSYAGRPGVHEWIDGNIIRSFVDEEDNAGFVECLYRSSLDVFQKLWAESSSLSHLKPGHRIALKEALARFYLWNPSSENGCLDKALENANDLRKTVLGLLGKVGKLLTCSEQPQIQLNLSV